MNTIEDLLTEQEREDLYRDLAEMVRCRRRAEAESAFMVLS